MMIFRRLLAPAAFLVALTALLTFGPEANAYFGIEPLGDQTQNLLRMARYLGVAWLLSRIADLVLSRMRPRNRPVPKLLRDLVSGLLYLVAIVSGALLLMGHSTGSALAGSGVVLALLGFAIRNVVADTLSGIALGLEAPFRIGDWVDIDGLARGRVIEIGWRTTRLLTRDSTYVILPNSQISRQRIVNYSAPRSEFRVQMEIVLDHATVAAEGADILRNALLKAPLIKRNPAPDVRIQSIDPEGVRYALRYWLERFDHDVDARDAIWREVDTALRQAGATAPVRRARIIGDPAADPARGASNIHPLGPGSEIP
ncbi:MAG TPA: mechanosensitive ion channel [Paracoccus sp.]|nr:mechanosensitive ion channel [Paracoccus sp. (in: a-proteobacteria)]